MIIKSIALRLGAIIRGMNIDEEDVRYAEKNRDDIIKNILATGDQTLIKILKVLPEESYGRLKNILNAN